MDIIKLQYNPVKISKFEMFAFNLGLYRLPLTFFFNIDFFKQVELSVIYNQ
jgi:hypothetical protein